MTAMMMRVGMETIAWYWSTYSVTVRPAYSGYLASSSAMATLSEPSGVGMIVAVVAMMPAAVSGLMPALRSTG